jgi:hypothetical protein|tara:strand:+ start:102 stop:323 length:222 start_codon:yes stop_codon:yes gene_type:complete
MSESPYDLDGQDLIDFYEAMEAHLSKMVDDRNNRITALYDKIARLECREAYLQGRAGLSDEEWAEIIAIKKYL